MKIRNNLLQTYQVYISSIFFISINAESIIYRLFDKKIIYSYSLFIEHFKNLP